MNNIEFKKIRKKLKLSQTDLADKIGVSMRTVQNWEAGINAIPKTVEFATDNLLIKVQKHTNTEKFGEMLKKVSFRFPVAEISQKTGYSKGSISEILKGKRSPTSEFLEKFASEFNIDSEDFEIQSIPKTENLQVAIKKLRLRFPIKEISEKTGFNKGSVSSYVSGKIPPSIPFIEKFSTAFNVDLSKLMQVENSLQKNLEAITGYYYPDVHVSAGFDKEIVNNELKRTPINIPWLETGLIFINVYGDSMCPAYNNGDIIGIKETEFDYIVFGFAYVVILQNDDVYIKKGSDKENIILESENSFYEPKEIHLSKIKKVYQIKGVIKKEMM